jgi:hypothetical protein
MTRDLRSVIRFSNENPFGLDFLVRSPQKLAERLAIGDVLLQEITQKGKVLYESKDYV